MATRITLVDMMGAHKGTLTVQESVADVVTDVNAARANKDALITLSGEDGKAFSVRVSEVSEVRED